MSYSTNLVITMRLYLLLCYFRFSVTWPKSEETVIRSYCFIVLPEDFSPSPLDSLKFPWSRKVVSRHMHSSSSQMIGLICREESILLWSHLKLHILLWDIICLVTYLLLIFFLFQILSIKLEDMMKNTIYILKFLLFPSAQCPIGNSQVVPAVVIQTTNYRLYS